MFYMSVPPRSHFLYFSSERPTVGRPWAFSLQNKRLRGYRSPMFAKTVNYILSAHILSDFIVLRSRLIYPLAVFHNRIGNKRVF